MNESIQSPADEDELQYPSFLRRVRNRVIKRKKMILFFTSVVIVFSYCSWRVYQRHQLLYKIMIHNGSVGVGDGPLGKFTEFIPQMLFELTRSVDVVRIRILDPAPKSMRVLDQQYLDEISLFHELRVFQYSHGPVVPRNISQLANNRQIIDLLFHHTTLPSGFFYEIAVNCAQIKELDLANSTIRGQSSIDQELKSISVLKGLVSLGLEGTTVSDEGIAQLENVDTLEYLCVSNTQVSQQAIDRLCEELPKLKIVEQFGDAQHHVRRGPSAKKWAQ